MNDCIKCGECLAVCHAYKQLQGEFSGPRRLAVSTMGIFS